MAGMAQAEFDIAIVGGGPVGLSMALALVRSMTGLRIALVDRRPLAVPHDQRASAIAAGVRRVFERRVSNTDLVVQTCRRLLRSSFLSSLWFTSVVRVVSELALGQDVSVIPRALHGGRCKWQDNKRGRDCMQRFIPKRAPIPPCE